MGRAIVGMKITLISLIALSSFALSAQTAHAQVGLTVAQCEAKSGKAQSNHGVTQWNRNGFTMSRQDGEDGEPIKHILYVGNSRYPLPIGQILNENFPEKDPSFVFHRRSWVSEVSGEHYCLEIEMD
jgi:hypothetical protein